VRSLVFLLFFNSFSLFLRGPAESHLDMVFSSRDGIASGVGTNEASPNRKERRSARIIIVPHQSVDLVEPKVFLRLDCLVFFTAAPPRASQEASSDAVANISTVKFDALEQKVRSLCPLIIEFFANTVAVARWK
jgi:hypothetical protein